MIPAGLPHRDTGGVVQQISRTPRAVRRGVDRSELPQVHPLQLGGGVRQHPEPLRLQPGRRRGRPDSLDRLEQQPRSGVDHDPDRHPDLPTARTGVRRQSPTRVRRNGVGRRSVDNSRNCGRTIPVGARCHSAPMTPSHAPHHGATCPAATCRGCGQGGRVGRRLLRRQFLRRPRRVLGERTGHSVVRRRPRPAGAGARRPAAHLRLVHGLRRGSPARPVGGLRRAAGAAPAAAPRTRRGGRRRTPGLGLHEPCHHGTRHVVEDGCVPLLDPAGRLAEFLRVVRRTRERAYRTSMLRAGDVPVRASASAAVRAEKVCRPRPLKILRTV